MSLKLPVELWYDIFSYLDLEDLCRARAVCRIWWDQINCDHLWRPKLLGRKITRDCIPAKTEDDVNNAKGLENCEWADICFKYHATVIRNWALLQTKRTECQPSTECLLIFMPYMLKTFDPYNVVEVQRLSNGAFVPCARISLPHDDEEGGYEPHMTAEGAFAVSKNCYTIIFKLRDEVFCFEKALAFTESLSLVSCSDESEAPQIVRNSYGRTFRGIMYILSLIKDVIWIYENVINVIVVWDYLKSELKLRLELTCTLEWPRAYTTETQLYVLITDEVYTYWPHGQQRWFYKKKQASHRNVSCDRFGCGFIERDNSIQRAVYCDMSKASMINLEVVNPIALALDATGGLAYCLFLRDKIVNLSCTSTSTGKQLWESVVGPAVRIQHEHLNLDIKMSVILKKYIVIQGVNEFFSPGHVSVYSSSNGKMVWSHSFHPAKIIHLSNHFIVTKDRYPRGGMRYKYEVYNFLLPSDDLTNHTSKDDKKKSNARFFPLL